MNTIVSSEWLAGRLGDPAVRIVDVRWYLDPARRGRDAYAGGHIPGAVFLDMDTDLAAPGGGRGRPLGRHPWPDAGQITRVLSAAGIGPDTHVVAYDDQAGAMAARLWYLLRAYGHEKAAVLDGGLVKWTAEGRPLETDTVAPAPAAFVARPRAGWVLDKAAMVRESPHALVLDARAGPRYRGESDPVDPRAGHIPGARHAPFAENLTSGPVPVFRPPAELRARYEALGAATRAPIVYCGSGVTACHDLLAMEVAGLPGGRLYAGSWSEWSADASLPLATGE